MKIYKRIIALALLGCLLTGCSKPAAPQTTDAPGTTAEIPTETEHPHTFGDWKLKETATCAKEGVEERVCTGCQKAEYRPTEKLPHELNAYNICKTCKYVEFDPNADFAELGVFSNYYYTGSTIANHAWDIKIWDNMVYRGTGDYDKNAGTAPIIAFNKDTQSWVQMGVTADQAVHRFVEIGGTLYAPGIDANESWDLGNFYVLEEGKWKKVRNLPNGIHNFDMIEYDGKIFAGLGTETLGNSVAFSDDGGKTFRFAPLYQDGKPMDTSSYKSSRTYEFMEYNGQLYALVSLQMGFGYMSAIFRYENEKMVYVGNASKIASGRAGRNYWNGKVEWNGICYLTTTSLNAVTDFANPDTHKQIPMPNKEIVSDILLYNNELYVLGFIFTGEKTYDTVIYKSATGEEGSFTKVASFNYPALPMSFDFDGAHFYIGTGNCPTDSAKVGMLLRVKA